ncbi:RNA polymerase sigma factor [Phaeocystidibacter luteus]|uniref:RNA polymerase sigma factor n=1 Tax=Phaeocystidibacter luteus TaxID=911197 RepID=A0A6N6RLL6_9FLAO|nr:RNA polymerase sigma factor [Phaeocystidibacter luteus]KAB2814466.1 RNA polymerase sigma factor [Phaeocystidibacter luteus]
MSNAEFGSLINEHHQFLKQLALKLTKRLDDAEDLIQETFYKAIKNQDKYRNGTNLKGWLYTIMKNTFINNYRKKKNQNTFVDETDNSYFINSTVSTKDVNTDSLVDHEFVMRQIESIEKNYLEAFMMHYNGYKYEEISEILDIPLGTVKSRIFLARKKMMAKLKDYRIK